MDNYLESIVAAFSLLTNYKPYPGKTVVSDEQDNAAFVTNIDDDKSNQHTPYWMNCWICSEKGHTKATCPQREKHYNTWQTRRLRRPRSIRRTPVTTRLYTSLPQCTRTVAISTTVMEISSSSPISLGYVPPQHPITNLVTDDGFSSIAKPPIIYFVTNH